MHFLRTVLLLLCFALLPACGGGSNGNEPVDTTPRATLAGLEFASHQMELLVGESRTVEAWAVWDDGARGELPAQIQWRSDDPNVADIGPRSTIIAVGVGSTRIWINDAASGKNTSLLANVVDKASAALLRITLSVDETSLPMNDTLDARVYAVYDDGKRVDVTANVAWFIDDTSVIDFRDGTLVAVGAGETRLDARYSGKSTSTQITVISNKRCTDCIALQWQTAPPKEIALNETATLRVIATLSNNNTREVTDQVTWTVSPNTLASLNGNILRPQETGTGTLTATLDELTLTAAIAIVTPREVIPEAQPNTVSLVSARPDKVRYAPGDTVNLQLNIHSTNTGKVKANTQIILHRWLDTITAVDITPQTLLPGQNNITLTFTAPNDDFVGYLAQIQLLTGTTLQNELLRALDVSSDWTRFPRYGYLSNFGAMLSTENRTGLDITGITEWLADHNINTVQYYDWQYKHHQPLAGTPSNPAKQWPDIANRTTYLDTLRGFIKQGHARNIAAMHYNLLFGTYPNAQADGVKYEWGMFKEVIVDGKKTLVQDRHGGLPDSWATQEVLLVNPDQKEWQNYIFNKTKEMFQVLAFDGWHVDQLGDRQVIYDAKGQFIDLREKFDPFLSAARTALGNKLIFNAVNNYGGAQVAARAPVDGLYVEVWPDSSYGGHSKAEYYNDLKNIIERGWISSQYRKNTTIAGYMNYAAAKNGATRFNTPGVAMANATILASGGWHIELGDDKQMLSSEYFPSTKLKMDNTLAETIQRYNRFAAAHQNLLRDTDLRPTYPRVHIANTKLSAFGDAGTVWHFARTRRSQQILHLLNLTGHSSVTWRDDNQSHPTPPKLSRLAATYCTDTPILSAAYASPDNTERPQPLALAHRENMQQHCVDFTLPELNYWSMVVFNVEPSRTPHATQYTQGISFAANFTGWKSDTYEATLQGDHLWEGIVIVDNNDTSPAFKLVPDANWGSALGLAKDTPAFTGLPLNLTLIPGAEAGNVVFSQPRSAKLHYAFNEKTRQISLREAKALYWIGHTNHYPSDGTLTGNNDLWINTDTYPISSAKRAILLYSTDQGSNWRTQEMEFVKARAAPEDANDWWHANLGKPKAGTTLQYAIKAQGYDGRWIWSTANGTQPFSITVR
jgi:dextranase